MAKPDKFHFSGYATKNGLKCTDGRTILKDAFKEQDGAVVPLVWQHRHDEPGNVLGHAVLENREDGVYAYGVFNTGKSATDAKILVEHGDIDRLSIYANGLVEKSKSVVHGIIREVSLVLAGANPGAKIDNLVIEHADGSYVEDEEEADITTDAKIELPKEEIKHSDNKVEDVKKTEEKKDEVKHAETTSGDAGETIGDVFETLTPKQKTAVYAIIGEVMGGNAETDNTDKTDTAQQSDTEGDKGTMKHNVFEGKATDNNQPGAVLTHAQFDAIVEDARKCGSFKEAFMKHVATYGIENIDYLFPDARAVTNEPTFIKRDTGWVPMVLSAVRHSPFSRIKTIHADITGEAARALGYVKGSLKKEEVINLLRRTTTPTTIYKKQKLDREDIVDITDLDVVVWLKAEMRLMLNEELARVILVGDGRAAESEDKISETNIRPIYHDADLYALKVLVTPTPLGEFASDIIDAVARARAQYKGSGNPTFYTTSTVLSDMLLMKDTLGRRIYQTQGELEAAMRVKAIVEVPVFENLTRDVTDPAPATLGLIGILVNLWDYTIGADKGGEISMFDDFDIDYNQYKYLMETRVSGALTLPASAIVFEQLVVPGPQ